MSLRTLVLALVVLLALPALAQQGAQGPAIAVNGQPLAAGAVLGSTGDDLAVAATPYLRACGAQVRLSGNHLEAWWPGAVLTLDAGSDSCTWNGAPRRLREPVGTLGGDLVVRAVEIARVIEARVESADWGVAVWKSSASPAGQDGTSLPPMATSDPGASAFPPMANPALVGQVSQMGQEQPMSGQYPSAAPQANGQDAATMMPPGGDRALPPGLSMIPSSMSGGQVSGPPGAPPVQVSGLRGDSGPGLGGPPPQQGPYESPYQRPTVGGEAPGADPAVEPGPSPSPGAKPPRAVISQLDARRIMTFHLSTYEIKAKVRNEGSLPLTRPFQVQLLARGARNADFELLEAFLVRPLAAGEEVEVQKTADGHQYQSLQGMSITFKAVVIEDAPPRKSSSSAAPGPATVEGSSAEKSVDF